MFDRCLVQTIERSSFAWRVLSLFATMDAPSPKSTPSHVKSKARAKPKIQAKPRAKAKSKVSAKPLCPQLRALAKPKIQKSPGRNQRARHWQSPRLKQSPSRNQRRWGRQNPSRNLSGGGPCVHSFEELLRRMMSCCGFDGLCPKRNRSLSLMMVKRRRKLRRMMGKRQNHRSQVSTRILNQKANRRSQVTAKLWRRLRRQLRRLRLRTRRTACCKTRFRKAKNEHLAVYISRWHLADSW